METNPNYILSYSVKKNKIPQGLKLLLFLIPFMVPVFVFSYLPLYGWIFAFYNYIPGLKLSQCEFKGIFFFTQLFADPVQLQDTLRVLKNTFGISFLNLLTQPLPVIFAIFLVEIRINWFKKIVQTLTTMPNFISWIMVYTFAFAIFSVDDGFLNKLLIALNILHEPVNYLASPSHVWLTQTSYFIWKNVGYTSIIYLAAITSIDQQLYEAAKVDGAGRFRIIWNITIPGLASTFFVLLLLGIANFLNNGIQQYFVFENPMTKDSIEVLDLYVYNTGIKNGMYGYNYSIATAMGSLKSVVSVILLFVANRMSKMIRRESII